MARAQTVLAFDFGFKRIGTAVGQDVTRTAEALETVTVRNRQVDWAAISRLVETWQPDRFVVGRPRTGDGRPNELGLAIEKFARRIEGRYRRPVSLIDERLSSYAAADESAGPSRAGLDAVAARLILETWFVESERGP